VFERVRRESPATYYLKVCAMLVPKEMKVEHQGGIKAMTDEQLDASLEVLRELLAQRAREAANLIEGTAEPVALPAPEAQSEPTPTPKPPRNRTA
jgi:hypothetical protein